MSAVSELDDASLMSAAKTRDPKQMIEVGGELERRGEFEAAWRLLAQGSEALKPVSLPAWEGENGGTLLVRRKMRHLGAEIRMSRFIGVAARRFDKVVVATEDRLVDLLRRTFPEVSVVAKDTAALPPADCEASYERLALYLGRNAAEIATAFRPLVPPHPIQPGNAIGLAWYSSNLRKPLPTLADWSAALSSASRHFASLQYNEEEAGISLLSSGLTAPIASSRPVDQIADVDGFCEQVAGVEGVLTISNTTAHVAGMLGVPCVVLLDDVQHLTWPRDRERSPFYPNLVTVRQQGRAWIDVIRIGMDRLDRLIEETRR